MDELAGRVLARHPLFAGVPAAAAAELADLARARRLAAGEVLCRAGEPGESLYVILEGLAHVHAADGVGPAAKLRRGEVVGEMSLLTGEPRSASVVAAMPLSVLEVDHDAFARLTARHPVVLANLTRILSGRLRETTARLASPGGRGEVVALVAAAECALVPELVEATRAATPRSVAALDARRSPDAALARLDDALVDFSLVLLLCDLVQPALPALLAAADRVVGVVATPEEASQLRAAGASDEAPRPELVVLRPGGRPPAAAPGLPTVGTLEAGPRGESPPAAELRRLGRRLARTRLGLALGAGGARGYAHAGVVETLEAAGFVVDAVAGSSIGAVVGALLGLGATGAELESLLRTLFAPETVEAMFRRSFGGTASGLPTLERAFREATEDADFDDLRLPLAVLAVDLDGKRPVAITEGPVWQALLAATALAGVYPPVERDGRRLVDALALVPVPTEAVRGLGADLVAAVNLMPRHTLAAWPGHDPSPLRPQPSGSRTLDSLLEVLDLAQLDAAEQQTARADVPLTPAFGPSTWRDFHLADLFLEAGRAVAAEGLPALEALARPEFVPTAVTT